MRFLKGDKNLKIRLNNALLFTLSFGFFVSFVLGSDFQESPLKRKYTDNNELPLKKKILLEVEKEKVDGFKQQLITFCSRKDLSNQIIQEKLKQLSSQFPKLKNQLLEFVTGRYELEKKLYRFIPPHLYSQNANIISYQIEGEDSDNEILTQDEIYKFPFHPRTVHAKDTLFIGQGEAALLSKDDSQQYIITDFLYPCQGIVIWNPKTKDTFLGHRDSTINFQNVIKVLNNDLFKNEEETIVYIYTNLMEDKCNFGEFGYWLNDHKKLLTSLKESILSQTNIKNKNLRIIAFDNPYIWNLFDKEYIGTNYPIGIGVDKNTGQLFHPLFQFGSPSQNFILTEGKFGKTVEDRLDLNLIEKGKQGKKEIEKFVLDNLSSLFRKSILLTKNSDNTKEIYFYKTQELYYIDDKLFSKFVNPIYIYFKKDKKSEEIEIEKIENDKPCEFFDFKYPYQKIL
jgi:hypothetical protein